MPGPHARRHLLATLVLLVVCGATAADTVVKRNGQRIEGEIVEQTADKVVLKTKFGTIEIPRSDILEVEEGLTSAEQFKQRWEEVDKEDALALLELAEWCEENRLTREARKVYRRVLNVDPDNEQAHRELGDVFHEGKWISKREYDKLEKQRRAEEKKAREAAEKSGKADRSGSSADPLEGLGDLSADIEPFLDAVRDNEEADEKIAMDLEDFFGQRFSVATSTHFSIRAQLPPPDVARHLELAERLFVRNNRMFGLPPDQEIWRGPMQIFHVKQKNTFVDLVDWIADSGVADIDGEQKKFFKDGGGMIISSVPLCGQYERNIPLEEAMAHWIGQNWMLYYSRGAARPWLREGFAMFTSISEYGTNRLYCTTNTKYANQIEVADKNSDSAYQLVCFDIVDGALEDPDQVNQSCGCKLAGYHWADMVQKDLNSLDFAHLAKSWSVTEFLMRDNLEKFKQYISLLPRYESEVDVLQKSFGWTPEELDERWVEYVEANYSRTPPK